MSVRPKKVIISGAGIVGLLVAQALKARGIEFTVFDRDLSVGFRENAGWAITLHWALKTFLELLPADLASEVYGAQVRKDFHEHDSGMFKYLNASTGEIILAIPPSQRLRVRREEIRRILLKGIDVQWDCKLEDITYVGDKVQVKCESGRCFEGDILLGCEGSNSITRKLLCGPEEGSLNYLPIRFCGAKVRMTGAEMLEIEHRFDPLLFQGTVPENGTFFWFSSLATPDYTQEEDLYYAQVNLSWKIPDTEEPFSTGTEKSIALMAHAQGLHKDLYALVEKAAAHPSDLVEIKLADWPRVQWETNGHRVLLLGDAAHAMTMYRGEAANHGITDVMDLVKEIDKYESGELPWEQAVDNYCAKVYARAHDAVLLSRQACLDAHDFSKISADSTSPLLSMRKKT